MRDEKLIATANTNEIVQFRINSNNNTVVNANNGTIGSLEIVKRDTLDTSKYTFQHFTYLLHNNSAYLTTLLQRADAKHKYELKFRGTGASESVAFTWYITVASDQLDSLSFEVNTQLTNFTTISSLRAFNGTPTARVFITLYTTKFFKIFAFTGPSDVYI